ncbi:hypothetical protein L284_08190 [Novosphingobium lindaniclasticum LE124]|uniref:Uncharacterized protein n=1 Tax=Novosphingobium lindaniclasticum LE124 TaxID=1096930 RepID=T0HWS4_9SPHN|nr:hypothetical protein L284_08190 [Novosphingobium lindaniclasticum LE124]
MQDLSLPKSAFPRRTWRWQDAARAQRWRNAARSPR